MSTNTTYFDLVKPAKTDSQAVSVINGNMDTIDTEMHKPPLTVNNIEPDPETRDIAIETVPFADNLSSDIAQYNSGTFIQRTSGGDASIGNGTATLVSIKGNYVRTGYVPESLSMKVNSSGDDLTATIDRDTFVAYVNVSSTITLTYTSSWSADPALYGVTVTGTPQNGDTIVITYVKENRGTITITTPASFNSTGWNLYNNSTGRARVIKYSNLYGFRIDGSYTSIAFAETLSGAQTSVTVTDHNFMIPSDGYIFVTGGDATTCIYETWSDWTDGYQGEFEAYTLDTIDLAEVMLSFPYGLMTVENYTDEIDFSSGMATRRIERVLYNSENLEYVTGNDLPYIADTNYIYYVLPENDWVETSITLTDEYTVSDHGIEYYIGTTVPVPTEILYDENLKDKLRRDVVTISEQSLTAGQQEQVRENIGAASAADVAQLLNNAIITRQYTYTTTASIASGAYPFFTAEQFNVSPIEGYSMASIRCVETGSSTLLVSRLYRTVSGNIIQVRNFGSGNAASGKVFIIEIVWVKNALFGT